MSVIDVPMSDVVKGLTLEIRVTGVKVFKARMWIGCKVIWLGARIIGCKVEIRDVEH